MNNKRYYIKIVFKTNYSDAPMMLYYKDKYSLSKAVLNIHKAKEDNYGYIWIKGKKLIFIYIDHIEIKDYDDEILY